MDTSSKNVALLVGGIIGAFGLYCIVQRFNKNPKIWYRDLPLDKESKTIFPFGIIINNNNPEHTTIKDGYVSFGKDSLLKHEMTHWNQFRKDGLLLFKLKYAMYNKKYGYFKNPYEVEAFKNSGQDEYIKKMKS